MSKVALWEQLKRVFKPFIKQFLKFLLNHNLLEKWHEFWIELVWILVPFLWP